MNFEHIQYISRVDTWEEAIEISSRPLLEKGFISENYQNAMIENVKKLGSYMILMPGIAMPHSRPEDGVNKTSISLLILDEPVVFPEDQSAWFVLCLAAESSEAHMDVIEYIAELLGDDEKLEQVKNAKSLEKIKEILL